MSLLRRLKRLWLPASWWRHLLLLAVILFAILPVVSNGAPATPDEGVYAAQAELVSRGVWDGPRPAAALHLGQKRDAVHPEVVSSSRSIPYARHPAFSVLLAPLIRVGGFDGLLVLSVLGTIGAAAAAALLARRLDPRYAIATLWLVGLGSPLVFDAYLVAAHSIGAALCGFAVLGVAAAVDEHRSRSLAYALPALALLVNVRSEGLIVGVALGGLTGLIALAGRFTTKVDLRGVVVAAEVLATPGRHIYVMRV